MTKAYVRHATALALGGAFLLAGCDDSPTGTDPGQIAAEVEITQSAVSLTAIGASDELSVVALDEEGEEISNPQLDWSSSDESVATVDEDGVVTAVGNGTATITVTSGDASDSVPVAVEQVAESVEVTPDEVTLGEVGESEELAAVVLDEEGVEIEGADVVWGSSDEDVAVVDAAGVVSAVGAGTATITATSGEASGSAEVVVELDD